MSAAPVLADAPYAVTADQPLAVKAGMEILREGGDAVDAAVAASAVLGVARPHMNGVGGDGFWLIYRAKDRKVYALNASGRSGASATLGAARARGLTAMPERGGLPVTVPGHVAGWAAALKRFGTRPLGDLLQPAVTAARDGFPVSDKLAQELAGDGALFDQFPNLGAIYRPEGHSLYPGDRLVQADLATTLAAIAERGPDALYRGPTAKAIAEAVARGGGFLTEDDLAAHRCDWVEPIATDYHGLTICAFPPNAQGLALLLELNIVSQFDMKKIGHNTAPYLHRLVEAKKLAFADRDRWVTDPDAGPIPLARLLSTDYAAAQAKRIDPARAAAQVAPGLEGGDTAYLAVVDSHGNAVSLIQSLYYGFGSGVVAPGTGVILQNRGALFSLDPDHPNRLAPRKRTFHTLCPALALKGDRLAIALGTPGADGQPQAIAQVLNNMLLFGMTPQEAIEAPRLRGYAGTRVRVESRILEAERKALTALGHTVEAPAPMLPDCGSMQVIRVADDGRRLEAGADPRSEAAGAVGP